MSLFTNEAQVKKSARALERFLAELGMDLKHGQALDALARIDGFENWNGLSACLVDESQNPTVSQPPRIQDVPLQEIANMNVGGGVLNVIYWYPDAIALLSKPELSEAQLDETLVEYGYSDDDGFWEQSSMSVADFRELVWDDRTRCFLAKDIEYRFYRDTEWQPAQ